MVGSLLRGVVLGYALRACRGLGYWRAPSRLPWGHLNHTECMANATVFLVVTRMGSGRPPLCHAQRCASLGSFLHNATSSLVRSRCTVGCTHCPTPSVGGRRYRAARGDVGRDRWAPSTPDPSVRFCWPLADWSAVLMRVCGGTIFLRCAVYVHLP